MNITIERLIDRCMEADTDDPVKIFRTLVRDSDVPMHGGIHHRIVPMCLITAYWNVVKDFDLRAYLMEAVDRAEKVPETICGYWGTCGSAVGTGIFLSVITRTTPLTKGKRWGQCNLITSQSLERLGEIGGPRCCKRNAVLSITSACDYVKREMGIEMHPSAFGCNRVKDNPDCIGAKCPYYTNRKE